MRKHLMRNLLLVGAGAVVALLISFSTAHSNEPTAAQQQRQEQQQQQEEPARLDRTFENEGTGGAADAGGAATEEVPEEEGRGGAGDAGMGARGAEGGAATIETRGPDANKGVDVAGKATRDDHTNIIVYGPNGLRPDEANPNAEEAPATGGAGDAGAGATEGTD